jgi:hypothetical protein
VLSHVTVFFSLLFSAADVPSRQLRSLPDFQVPTSAPSSSRNRRVCRQQPVWPGGVCKERSRRCILRPIRLIFCVFVLYKKARERKSAGADRRCSQGALSQVHSLADQANFLRPVRTTPQLRSLSDFQGPASASSCSTKRRESKVLCLQE